MKRIEDIKEFKDIDTYYEISKIVDEVFQDRVEAHKHLVIANKEIERLNNIINEIEKLQKQLQQKENIIKEVREYIESYMPNYDFDKTNLLKILEILDKGE